MVGFYLTLTSLVWTFVSMGIKQTKAMRGRTGEGGKRWAKFCIYGVCDIHSYRCQMVISCKKNSRINESESQGKTSGWGSTFGNHLHIEIVKAKAWLRRPQEGFWSWRAGSLGLALGALVVAGWEQEGGISSKLESHGESMSKARKAQNHSCPQPSCVGVFLGFQEGGFTY